MTIGVYDIEEPGNPFRMSLLTAITGGAHAADNISALLRGRELSPLSFAHYGQAISMGPNDAVGFLGYPDDKARGPIYRGQTAVVDGGRGGGIAIGRADGVGVAA